MPTSIILHRMGMMHFTRKERQALLLSGSLALLAVGVSFFWRSEPLTLYLIERDPEEVSSYRPGYKPDPGDESKSAQPRLSVEPAKKEDVLLEGPMTPTFFDPNVADKETMMQAGLPSRVAQSILNYRSKGGRYNREEDLKKIYTMTDSLYEMIRPYIRMTSIPESRERKFVRVDINNADEATWQMLPGIGKGYAGRIVRFRNILGGFVSPEQVAETKGLPDSVFQRILPLLDFTTGPVRIKINQLEKDSLARHPYINYKQATLILNYRNHHGPFLNVEGLAQTKAFQPQDLEKIAPYVDFSTD